MIRQMVESDVSIFKAVHEASGFDYEFPDLDDPLFIVKKTVEELGRPVQGIALKVQAEVYLWVDPAYAGPEERWQKLQDLCEAAKLAAWEKGLDCLVCVVPPEIADTFEKRLKDVGMSRDRPWPKFTFSLIDYIPNRVEGAT